MKGILCKAILIDIESMEESQYRSEEEMYAKEEEAEDTTFRNAGSKWN